MKERFYIGGIFIAAGILFLLANFGLFSLEHVWPIFVMAPGIIFFIAYLDNKQNYGFLMPASILTIIGLLFFYCEFAGWHRMETLWPFFIIAPGCGFFLMYYLGPKEKGLLIPASILTFIGFLNLAVNNPEGYIWPIILIVVGLWMLIFKKD
jgi:hypothetical protein